MPAVLGAIAGVVGAASTIFGAATQASGLAQQQAAQQQMIQQQTQYNQEIIGQEGSANKVRQQAMELDAHRRSVEILRQQNVSHAMALTAATAGGAQTSSGLQGAYAGISGRTAGGLRDVSQNLHSGESLFGIENAMNSIKYNYAGTIGPLQSSALAGAGQMALGGAISNIGTSAGRVLASFPGIFGSGGQSATSMMNGFNMPTDSNA